MYNLTRQEVADMLGISTRSVDRYIRAGKLRAKKIGKIVYIHSEDAKNIGQYSEKNVEIISGEDLNEENFSSDDNLPFEEDEILEEKTKLEQENSNIIKNTEEKINSNISEQKEIQVAKAEIDYNKLAELFSGERLLGRLYEDMRKDLDQRDNIILELTKKVGENSSSSGQNISLVEHKKNQFILEQAKNELQTHLEEVSESKDSLEQTLKTERKLNIVLIIFLAIMLIVVAYFWANSAGIL